MRSTTLPCPTFGEGVNSCGKLVLSLVLAFGLLIVGALNTAAVAFASSEQNCSLDATSALDEQIASGISVGLASYQEVGQETGVNWGVLAGIHYRENGLNHSNPADSDHGIMGLVTLATQNPGMFPRGQSLDQEQFEKQLRLAADFLKKKAKERPAGSVDLKYSSSLADYGRALHEYYGHLDEFDQVAKDLGKDESWMVNPYVVNSLEGYPSNLTLFQVDHPDLVPDTRDGALRIAVELNRLCGSPELLAGSSESLVSSLGNVGDLAVALESLPVQGLWTLGLLTGIVVLLLANIRFLTARSQGSLIVLVLCAMIGSLWHYMDITVAAQPETLGLVSIRSGFAALVLMLLALFVGQAIKEIGSSSNTFKMLWRGVYQKVKKAFMVVSRHTRIKTRHASSREMAIAYFLLGTIKSLVLALLFLVVFSLGGIVAALWLSVIVLVESLAWVAKGGYRQVLALLTVVVSYLISSRWVFGSMPFMLWLITPLLLVLLISAPRNRSVIQAG